MKVLNKIIIPFLLILITSSAVARTAKILYFKAPASAPAECYIYQDGEDAIKVPLPKFNFSDTFSLKEGVTELHFLPKPLTEDEELPANPPAVVIGEKWQKILLLVVEDPTNLVFPVKVIAVNMDSIEYGDFIFANRTKFGFSGDVGKQKLKLGPNSRSIIKKAAQPGGSFHAHIDRFDLENKKQYAFIRQVWRQGVKQSNLIIFYKLPDRDKITFYSAAIYEWETENEE